MKNHDKEYLKQAVELLETLANYWYDNEEISKDFKDDVKAFLVSEWNYQGQKDQKMYGDL